MASTTESNDARAASGAGRLAWTLDIMIQLSDDAVESHVIGPRAKIAFEGKLEAPTYLYLVQLDDKRIITVLYPPDGASVQVPAGDPVRAPAEGWAVTVTKGVVRLVGSAEPLSRAEIAELAGGREPEPGHDSLKGS